jgi:hypothetical protein
MAMEAFDDDDNFGQEIPLEDSGTVEPPVTSPTIEYAPQSQSQSPVEGEIVFDPFFNLIRNAKIGT